MLKALLIALGLFTVVVATPAFADVTYTTTNPPGGVGGSAATPGQKDTLGDGYYTKKNSTFYDSLIRSNSLLGGYDDIGKEGPVLTAARIVNFLLSLLGVFSLAIMVYAGFLWLTSQGNEEDVQKAKGILAGTAVGLFVILASYGITSYVFSTFVSITN